MRRGFSVCWAGLLAALCAAALAASAVAAAERWCAIPAEQIYSDIGEVVVQVTSFGVDPHRVAGRVSSGTGSGLLFGDDLVLTNYHVVHDGELVFVHSDSWSHMAEIIGADPALDIALLALTVPVDTAPDVKFGAYESLRVGQTVYVIGYPLGIGRTMTTGIVSGLDRKIPLNTISWTTRYIQTDAAISPGNSGGPLLDSCGRLIGLVTLTSSHPGAENVGYALPIDTVDRIVRDLLEHGRVIRAWHGLYGQMVSPLIARLMLQPPPSDTEGFLIETIEPGSSADRAGLRGGYFPVLWGGMEVLLGGDIILEVDGARVTSLEQSLDIVSALEVGTSVHLLVWRDGETFEVDAELEERPDHASDLWTGPGQ